MVRNGDIRGFFGAKASSSSTNSQPEATSSAAVVIVNNRQQQQQEKQLQPPSPRTPPRSSSRQMGAEPPKRQFGPQDEIKGSDDSDDSDASLASLSVVLGRKPGYERPSNTASTPQAKRVASSSSTAPGRSPLTLQQKQQQQQQKTHKFDLKALITHTRQSERTEEVSRQAEELIKKADDSASSSSDGGGSSGDDDGDDEDEDEDMDVGGVGGGGSPSRRRKKKKKKKNLQQVAKQLLDGDGDGDEDENPKGDKIARAIDRTQVQGQRRRCYFFDLDLPPLFKPAKAPFPVDTARGPWRFLADPNTRSQAIIHGLAHTVVARGRELPEELFEWVLDQVCVERDPRLRAQYCGLVAACRDGINNFVDGARLYGVLERIGGPKYAGGAEHGKLKSSPELVEDPYRGRDWSGLGAFLNLLQQMAPNLDPIAVVDAVQLLLRMSLDPVVRTAVRREHLAALEALVAVLPDAEATRPALPWDIACFGICSYVLKCTDDTVQRLAPITSIPKSSAKLAELRRRLAATVLFNDESFGCKPTDSSLDTDTLLERISRPDFTIRPTTDYEELRALVALLDIVIESGVFLRRKPGSDEDDHPSLVAGVVEGSGGRGRGGGGLEAQDRERDRKFDTDVDVLTFRLRALHDKIHDNGLLTRKEAKTAIDVVSKRLTYVVRTRPPVKTSIFDLQPIKEDADLPKQRDFMKSWAQRRAGAGAGAGVGAERRSPAAVV